jgi:homoserine dehydrogenase
VERLAEQGPIDTVEGVLNGTSNYILQRLSEGIELGDAVREAQDNGFAEADPASDLSGEDSVYKLAILAKHAFGITFSPDDIPCRGIENMSSKIVRDAYARGRVIKLVATCRKTERGIQAEVRPVELAREHPLAGAQGEENRVWVSPADGEPFLIRGKGAGRWPTAASVLADLLDLYRSGARGHGLPSFVGTIEVGS